MENKEGYCSHFATLATLMFRAYGIPARYVEGYYVYPDWKELDEYEGRNRIELEVTDENAHAWTEIYIEGYGWMPVEVTPDYTSLKYQYIREDDTEEPDSEKESETTENATVPQKMKPLKSLYRRKQQKRALMAAVITRVLTEKQYSL